MRFLMLAGFEQSTQWQCGPSLHNTSQPEAPEKWKLPPRRIKPQKPLLSAAHGLIRTFSLSADGRSVGFMDGFICRAHRRKTYHSADEFRWNENLSRNLLRIDSGGLSKHVYMRAVPLCSKETREYTKVKLTCLLFPGVIRRILISRFFSDAEAFISNARIIHPQTLFRTRVPSLTRTSLRDGWMDWFLFCFVITHCEF